MRERETGGGGGGEREALARAGDKRWGVGVMRRLCVGGVGV